MYTNEFNDLFFNWLNYYSDIFKENKTFHKFWNFVIFLKCYTVFLWAKCAAYEVIIMNSESKQQENIYKWELVILNHGYLVVFL